MDYLRFKYISATVTKDRSTVLHHFDFEEDDVFAQKAIYNFLLLIQVIFLLYQQIVFLLCGNTPIKLNETSIKNALMSM